MFHEESSTPRKVIFSIFLYNLAKASRNLVKDSEKKETLLGNLQESLLQVFSHGATFSSEYSQIRYYCLLGLTELILVGDIATYEVGLNRFRYRLIIILCSFR
jgi:hypothetical protein